MKPRSIVIFGGTGFVGRRLVAKLAAQGLQVTVPSRNPDRHGERLLPPGVQLRRMDVYDDSALRTLLAGQDAVVNLVGILNEAGDDGRGFQRVHVELTRRIITAMQASGVRRLLQMSALNAGRGSSYYLRSRGEAETVVQASTLDWTIFQPSVIFGPGDGLFCRFAELLKLTPVLPLARAEARFAPVFVGDVVEAFRRALGQESSIGEIYELYGPEVFTLAEIVRLTARQRGLKRWVLPLPDVLGRLQAALMDRVPGKPFSSDNFRSLLTDSVGGIDGLHRLGITATRVGAVLPDILGGTVDRFARYAEYRARR